MSRVIYYMGAGASYGRKESRKIIYKGSDNERLSISEGMPIISEIGPSLLCFREAIRTVNINPSEIYSFLDDETILASDVIQARDNLLSKIDELHQAVIEHATIDTYAKKLYLSNMDQKLSQLKELLCLFFIWIQLESKTDQRYDTFLANILQPDLYFPEEISVISWNYDSQFELAYSLYSDEKTLPVFDKNAWKQFPNPKNCGRIFKVNGSATLGDFNTVKTINSSTGNNLINLIACYDRINSDTSKLGYQLHSHLSFAWETAIRQTELFSNIQSTVKDTESVVVIGYSFPYFNREIDRRIFGYMSNLKTIYIQDPKPEAVEPALMAILPNDRKITIAHQPDCTQFYLPKEL